MTKQLLRSGYQSSFKFINITMSNIIFPIGKETNLSTTTTISARFVNLLNTAANDVVVAILDDNAVVVSFFTLIADERLTIEKPISFSLSATSDIKAVPVIRTQ